MNSELDSIRFGFPVAKCGLPELRSAGGAGYLRSEGFRLCVARCDLSDIAGCNWLEEEGFRIADAQVCYRKRLSEVDGSDAAGGGGDLAYRVVGRDSAESVESLVGECFEGYGHYAADPRLDIRACQEIYIDWARRSLEDPAVATILFGAFAEGRLVGFLSLLECREGDGAAFGKGIMGAVAPAYRSRGVFRDIIRNSLSWSKGRGHEWQEHNVLVANTPVNRSFQRMGFVSSHAFATFHWWAD